MIKNILVAAAFGAAAIGAHGADNLLVNGELNGSTGSYVYNASPQSVIDNYSGTVPIQDLTVTGWDGSFVSIASGNGAWGNPNSLSGFNAATQGGYVAGVQADGVLSQDVELAAGTYMLTWVDANRGNSQNYSVSFSGGDVDYLFTTSFTTTGGWKTEHLLFTTTGGAGALSFTGGTIFGVTDATSFIDNVQLSAVPEPTSLLLMSIATLGLLAWRRRAQV